MSEPSESRFVYTMRTASRNSVLSIGAADHRNLILTANGKLVHSARQLGFVPLSGETIDVSRTSAVRFLLHYLVGITGETYEAVEEWDVDHALQRLSVQPATKPNDAESIESSPSAAAEVCENAADLAREYRVADEVASMPTVKAVDHILGYIDKTQLLRSQWRKVESAGWLRGYQWDAVLKTASTATGTALEQAQANVHRICKWLDANAEIDPDAPLGHSMQAAIDRGDNMNPFIKAGIEAIKRKVPPYVITRIDDERRYILERMCDRSQVAASSSSVLEILPATQPDELPDALVHPGNGIAVAAKPAEKSDDDLPKKKRKLSPSRVKAHAAYDYAMERIEGARDMTLAELHTAILQDVKSLRWFPNGQTHSEGICGNVGSIGTSSHRKVAAGPLWTDPIWTKWTESDK